VDEEIREELDDGTEDQDRPVVFEMFLVGQVEPLVHCHHVSLCAREIGLTHWNIGAGWSSRNLVRGSGRRSH